MRVLVADKDPYYIRALGTMLATADVEVVDAMDGDEALRLTLEHVPRVVVTASSLGQMGGFALSRELKTLSERGDIPPVAVVVLLERDADQWLAGWSRCDAWRVKPVDLDELQRLVRTLAIPREPASA